MTLKMFVKNIKIDLTCIKLYKIILFSNTMLLAQYTYQKSLSQICKLFSHIFTNSTMMMEVLQKEISNRVKKIKCQQPECRSANQETLEIAVVGDGKYKKKGIMCTSCFIDHELISSLGNVELHTLSIQKFLKVLTENYTAYAAQKNKPDWPPTKVDTQREQIRRKVIDLEKVVSKGVLDIMKYLQDSMKQATQSAKLANHQKSLQKLLELINQQDETEQQRINVTNQIKDVTLRIVKDHGDYRLSTEEQVKKNNEVIMINFKKKVLKAKEAINQLVEIHKKCLRHLIQ